jgi:hypothetical protein
MAAGVLGDEMRQVHDTARRSRDATRWRSLAHKFFAHRLLILIVLPNFLT